jgi:hypothetical protein
MLALNLSLRLSFIVRIFGADYMLCISHVDFNKTTICDVRTPKISANP